MYLYTKDPYEEKYQHLINKREKVGLQSATKIMGKTAVRTTSCFYPLPPLDNVEKQ